MDSVVRFWDNVACSCHPGHLAILFLCIFQFHANIATGFVPDINFFLLNLATMVHVWIFWSCGPILKHFTGNTTALLAMASGVLGCMVLSDGWMWSEWQSIGTALASGLAGALALVAVAVSNSKLKIVGRQMVKQRTWECVLCLVLLSTQPHSNLFSCVGGFMGGFFTSFLIVRTSLIYRFKCALGKLLLTHKAKRLKTEKRKLQIIGATVVDCDDDENSNAKAELILQRLSLVDIKLSFVNGCYRQQVR